MKAATADLKPGHFVLAFARISLRDTFAYKIDLFVKLVGYPARLLMGYFLWKTLFEHKVIPGSDFRSIFTYYMIVYLLTQMFPFVRMARSIREEIYSGQLSVYLARGYPHTGIWLSRFLAASMSYLLLVSPIAIPLILVFGELHPQPSTLIASLILIFLGTLIRGQMWYLMGISSFFTEENMGTLRVYDLIERFLSGAILPLFLFPTWLTNTVKYLPFPNMVFVPVDLLVRKHTPNEAWTAVCVAVCWSLLLGFGTRLVFQTGWKRFTAHGI